MKKYLSFFLFLVSNFRATDLPSISTLKKYKNYLEKGTYDGHDWSYLKNLPKSRYFTFKKVFKHFEINKGKIIVELGTTRSFVHGGLEGCNLDDTKYWTPNNPERWDWGAGSFTRVAAESLYHLKPTFHTVDLASNHINRCRLITKPFSKIMTYHTMSSTDFLKKYSLANGKIDLLYLDTGDMTPIEPTAKMHLKEAKIIVERNLLSENGVIVIDDVKHPTPRKFGEKSELGKAKYSIPYFLKNGYKVLESEFQFVLIKS